MFRTRLLRAFFATVVFGLASAAVGCGDAALNEGSSGSGKGPEFVTTVQSGRPVSTGASTMSASSTVQPPGTAFISACRPDGACLGGGCMGVCDPATSLITACQRCTDGAFTDCTDRPCQP